MARHEEEFTMTDWFWYFTGEFGMAAMLAAGVLIVYLFYRFGGLG